MEALTTEVKLIPANAETLYISHPTSSYGIFCWNDKGDLFLNSDWGFYAYAWRHYGDNGFTSFIATTNKEYLADKLSYNTNASIKRQKAVMKHVENLCGELIKFCQQNSKAA